MIHECVNAEAGVRRGVRVRGAGWARRQVLAGLAGLAAAAVLPGGCTRGTRREVTLYTSSDAFIAKPIVERYERESGAMVRMVTDTEATKTTGLVERLLAERARPVCDVWWSNELLGTLQLAQAGLLTPLKIDEATRAGFEVEGEAPGEGQAAWPRELCDEGGLWHGHALRVRVVGYQPRLCPAELVNEGDGLGMLLSPMLKGRIGMARPQFGTTRMQMVMWAAQWGIAEVREYLERLKENGVRLFDGNSAVVAALAHSEIAAGITDSDDVADAVGRGWPVASVPATYVMSDGVVRGALSIPNTVALVRGAPGSGEGGEGEKLARFLLSAACEEMLAASAGRNIPARAALRARMAKDQMGLWPKSEKGEGGGIVDAERAMKAAAEIDPILRAMF